MTDLRLTTRRTGEPAEADRTGGLRAVLGWWPFAAAVVAVAAAEAAVYAFLQTQGVGTTGDEPHYLVVARALSHLTVHPLHAYLADLRTHQLFDWAANAAPTNLYLQLYTGPHGPVSTHPLGLSILLAPFVAAGGAAGGRLGLMGIEAAGFVYFFHRAADLAGLSRTGRVLFALSVGGPAVWLAATQVYPDLLSGTMITCALVEVLAVESARAPSRFQLAVAAFSLAMLPWLHQQNLVPAVFILAAFWWASRRAASKRAAAALTAVSAVSWLLLLAYNLYGYGNALGLPQPFPKLDRAGIIDILGLLVDRHQGLFIQVPTVVVGLVGMWVLRRRAPAALVATLASAASLIYLNGTFVGAPYGGTSFAGRFEWASLVPLLLWCPWAIAAMARHRGRIWAAAAVTAGLWVLQAVPILRGGHSYYNALIAGPPWDPAPYPGWWGWFDRVLPIMIPGGPLLGTPWFALPVTAVLLAVGTAMVGATIRLDRPRLRSATAASLLVGAGAGAVALVAPLPLPARPLSFPGGALGAPFQTAATPAIVTVPLQLVGSGTFRLTARYTLRGQSGAADFVSFCSPGHSRVPNHPVQAVLQPGDRTATFTLRCRRDGTIWFETAVGPATGLEISSLRVAKTAAS